MASLSNYRARSDSRSFTDESAREHRESPSQCERVRAQRARAAAHAGAHEFLLRPYFSCVSEDQVWLTTRNSARQRNALTRITQLEWRSAQARHSYQIETTRALNAIEFFLAAVIIFLSLRRCQRWPRLLERPANQAIREARFDSHQRPRRRFSASLTACGLALPPVDLMT
jgi:hypothetical protein